MPTDTTRSKAEADHRWEPGDYGTCRRCGTDPEIAFPREQHPGYRAIALAEQEE